MGLREELTALRTRLEAGRPPEVLASMHRAVNELRESAAAQRILKVGDRALRHSCCRTRPNTSWNRLSCWPEATWSLRSIVGGGDRTAMRSW